MFKKKSFKKFNKVDPKKSKDPLELLEPFQEVIDEALDVDWGELENQDFPLAGIGVDKSTASQAVALVIRASRKGIVSLCAEVADLLKEKNRLLSVIEEQRTEITELMQNQMLPRSPSPVPPETADFSMQTLQEMECQTISLEDDSTQTENLILPCSQVKLLEEHEKLVTNTTDLKGVKFDCGNNYSVQCTCPQMMTSSTQNPVIVSIGTSTEDENKFHSELGYYEHNRLDHRLKDLEVKHKSLRTEAKDKASKNNKLETELTQAKQEIVALQKAIREIQTKEYEKIKEEERLRLEDTYSVDVQNNQLSQDETTSRLSIQGRNIDLILTDGKKNKELLSVALGKGSVSMSSSIFPGPILGCKCQMCTAFFRSSGILGFACTPYVTDSSGRNPVLKDLRKLVSLQNSKLQIHPNDKVLLSNNSIGTVRYVGHLDGAGFPSVVYAGIELDTPLGRHDGYLFGKRYFFAPQNHGMFLRLQDVVCVINKKQISRMSSRQRNLEVNNKNSSNRSVAVKRRHFRKSKTSTETEASTSEPSSDDSNQFSTESTR